MKWKEMALLAVFASTLSLGVPLGAQDRQPPVQDLTEGDVTEQRLIDALRPAEDPPAELLGTPRGIGVVARPVRPKCPFREKMQSRGIGALQRPAVNVAAIKVYFAFNSADIDPAKNPVLNELGLALQSHPLSLCCFQILGHTDDVGLDAYNVRLSQRRAQSVARYLTDHFGIDADRLEAIGLGERKPLVANSGEEGRSKNRRVEIATIGYGQAEM
jgi:outer membrane protein OmpA-like peptidoglycan-associated protein